MGGGEIPIEVFFGICSARPRGAKCFLGLGNQKICEIYPGDSAGDLFGMVICDPLKGLYK